MRWNRNNLKMTNYLHIFPKMESFFPWKWHNWHHIYFYQCAVGLYSSMCDVHQNSRAKGGGSGVGRSVTADSFSVT
jgi:hypothetical protein